MDNIRGPSPRKDEIPTKASRVRMPPAWVLDPYNDPMIMEQGQSLRKEEATAVATKTNRFLQTVGKSPNRGPRRMRPSSQTAARSAIDDTIASDNRILEESFHRSRMAGGTWQRDNTSTNHNQYPDDTVELTTNNSQGGGDNSRRSSVADDIGAAVQFRLREEAVFDNWISLTPSEVWGTTSSRQQDSTEHREELNESEATSFDHRGVNRTPLPQQQASSRKEMNPFPMNKKINPFSIAPSQRDQGDLGEMNRSNPQSSGQEVSRTSMRTASIPISTRRQTAPFQSAQQLYEELNEKLEIPSPTRMDRLDERLKASLNSKSQAMPTDKQQPNKSSSAPKPHSPQPQYEEPNERPSTTTTEVSKSNLQKVVPPVSRQQYSSLPTLSYQQHIATGDIEQSADTDSSSSRVENPGPSFPEFEKLWDDSEESSSTSNWAAPTVRSKVDKSKREQDNGEGPKRMSRLGASSEEDNLYSAPGVKQVESRDSEDNDDRKSQNDRGQDVERTSPVTEPTPQQQLGSEDRDDKGNDRTNKAEVDNQDISSKLSLKTASVTTTTTTQRPHVETEGELDEKQEKSPPFAKNRGRRVSFHAQVTEKSAELWSSDDDDDDDNVVAPLDRVPKRLSIHSRRSDMDASQSSHLDLTESWHDETDHGSTALMGEGSTASMGEDLITSSAHSSRRRGSMGSVASFLSRRSEDGNSPRAPLSPRRRKGVLRKTGNLAKMVGKNVVVAPVKFTGKVGKNVVMHPVKTGKQLGKNVVNMGRGGKGKKGKNRASTMHASTMLERMSMHGSPSGDIALDTGHLTFEEYSIIEDTLNKNLMFRELFEGGLHSLILSFEKTEVFNGKVIIRQGEDCDDSVYVVAEGEFSVLVDGVEAAPPFGTLGPTSLFGELGVVYNHSHASTISCKTDEAVLFRASNEAFTNAINIMPDDDNRNELDEAEVDMKAIDRAIDQLSGTKSLYGGEITKQYQPGRVWLWKQWHGTILEANFRSTAISMLVSLAMCILIRLFADPTWDIGHAPDPDHPLIQHLSLYYGVWSFTITLNTFVLTFYVNQAYLFWQGTNKLVRGIQGGISDFMLALACEAKRKEDGSFSARAEEVMNDVGASARLFHALFWANCARRFYCLATPTGMATMAQRGMMTPKHLKILQSLKSPYSTKHNACLEWMMISASQGIEESQFRNPDSLSRQLLETTCRLRATSVKVTDSLKSRMPLAYTHLVQILIDGFIWASPLALYAELGEYSILCVGVITLFYGGLMDLAKIFLDPLDNQHFKKTSINMGMDLGVLTRESNSGTSHFKENARKLPF